MIRTIAANIQEGITKKLNDLRERGTLSRNDFDYLFELTHKVCDLAKDAGRLEEILKIIER